MNTKPSSMLMSTISYSSSIPVPYVIMDWAFCPGGAKAVDVVPYPVDWDDKESFHEFYGYVKATADRLGIKIKWGGHFKNFFDGPHYQIED